MPSATAPFLITDPSRNSSSTSRPKLPVIPDNGHSRAATTACALSLLHPVFLILNFDPQQYSSARTHVSFRPHPPTPGQPGMWRSFTPVAVTSCHIGAVHCCPTKPCSSLCCETLCFFVLMFSFEILRRIDLSYPFHILFASCLVVKPRAASKTSWT